MLDFLKNLFGKKEEQIEISSKDLPEWFSQQLALSSQPLHARLNNIREKFSSAKKKLEESMEILEKAQLKNPKVTTREIQFMQGNRETYLKKVRLLFDEVSFPENFADMAAFHKGFSEELHQFGQSTARPYYILQEFFANESRSIALDIKKIETIVLDAKNLNEQFSHSMVGEINKKIDSLQKTAENHLSLTLEKAALESELEKQKRLLAELNQKKTNLQKSDHYKELERKRHEIELVSNRHKAKESELHNYFSVMEHALKKYGKISYAHEELTLSYLDNPVRALLEDKDLIIAKVFHNMRDAILRGEIELKDKKKDKTISTMNQMTESFLGNFLSEYNALSDQRKNLENAIRHDDTAIQLKEMENDIEQCWKNQVSIQKQLEKTQKSLEEQDTDKIRTELEKSLTAFLDKPVAIKD